MFHSFLIAAFVAGAIRPTLNAVALLQIVAPMAFIFGTVHVHVRAVAIGFIVFPVAVVDVAIGMPELTLSIGFIVLPFAFVASAIGPDLGAGAVTGAVFKVAAVDCTVFENEFFNKVQSFPLSLSF